MVYFTKLPGSRLGNWMFQYATAFALSKDGRVGCYLSDGDYNDPIVSHPFFKDVVFVTDEPKGYRLAEEGLRYVGIVNDHCDDNLILIGYFQSPKYFNRDRVLQLFSLVEKDRAFLIEKYSEAFSHADITSINVRRGDYLYYPHRFPFVGKRYYKGALSRHGELKDFLICSDDIEWCKKYFTKSRFPDRNFYFSYETSAVNDMHLASICKHNILANSTFSWWGGYLNENKQKITMAPSRWFGFSCIKQGGYSKDIYYEGTELIDNDYTMLEYCSAWLYGVLWRDNIRTKFVSRTYQILKGIFQIFK